MVSYQIIDNGVRKSQGELWTDLFDNQLIEQVLIEESMQESYLGLLLWRCNNWVVPFTQMLEMV